MEEREGQRRVDSAAAPVVRQQCERTLRKVERSSKGIMARKCRITISHLRLLRPLPVNGTVLLGVNVSSFGRRLTRYSQPIVTPSSEDYLLDVPVNISITIPYAHTIKRFREFLIIVLARQDAKSRSHSTNLGIAHISMSEVLQRSFNGTLSLYEPSGAMEEGNPNVRTVAHIEAHISSVPLSIDQLREESGAPLSPGGRAEADASDDDGDEDLSPSSEDEGQSSIYGRILNRFNAESRRLRSSINKRVSGLLSRHSRLDGELYEEKDVDFQSANDIHHSRLDDDEDSSQDPPLLAGLKTIIRRANKSPAHPEFFDIPEDGQIADIRVHDASDSALRTAHRTSDPTTPTSSSQLRFARKVPTIVLVDSSSKEGRLLESWSEQFAIGSQYAVVAPQKRLRKSQSLFKVASSDDLLSPQATAFAAYLYSREEIDDAVHSISDAATNENTHSSEGDGSIAIGVIGSEEFFADVASSFLRETVTAPRARKACHFYVFPTDETHAIAHFVARMSPSYRKEVLSESWFAPFRRDNDWDESTGRSVADIVRSTACGSVPPATVAVRAAEVIAEEADRPEGESGHQSIPFFDRVILGAPLHERSSGRAIEAKVDLTVPDGNGSSEMQTIKATFESIVCISLPVSTVEAFPSSAEHVGVVIVTTKPVKDKLRKALAPFSRDAILQHFDLAGAQAGTTFALNVAKVAVTAASRKQPLPVVIDDRRSKKATFVSIAPQWSGARQAALAIAVCGERAE